jgi:hypothetical protein
MCEAACLDLEAASGAAGSIFEDVAEGLAESPFGAEVKE